MGKARKVNGFEKILKRIPLKTKLKVSNEMAFISLLTELGYRRGKMWTPDEDKVLSKLMKFAEKHTEYQMKVIAKYKKNDGVRR